MEFQMGRIVSDIESEKSTRSRANADTNNRLDKLTEAVNKVTRMQAMMIGGVIVVQVVVQLLVK